MTKSAWSIQKNKDVLNASKTVTLLLTNHPVGVVVLHKSPNDHGLCLKLYGMELKRAKGEELLVSKQVVIHKSHRSPSYPYRCPGPEESSIFLNIFSNLVPTPGTFNS